ncbi:MAG: uroporphyrinogen-III synthase [Weeksellaceae bacterium]|nr:uroporphyrinogen-III synthase [Weeksellaceae bacterium]
MKVKSILVSQPQPNTENSPYLDLIKNEKIQIDFRPFIHVEGLSAKELRHQKINLANFNGVVFTSRNAVDNYFRLAKEMRFVVPDSMKYFCQSEAIAYYLQKYIIYRKRKVYIGGKSFRDLSTSFKKHKDTNFLIPSSDIFQPDIAEVMDGLNLKWQRAIMYQTVSSDLSDLSNVKYDILVFFSPMGIQSLFENFPNFAQDNTRIAVFGKSTHDAATEKGLRVDIPVPTPETPSMAMALEKYIKENNKK